MKMKGEFFLPIVLVLASVYLFVCLFICPSPKKKAEKTDRRHPLNNEIVEVSKIELGLMRLGVL